MKYDTILFFSFAVTDPVTRYLSTMEAHVHMKLKGTEHRWPRCIEPSAFRVQCKAVGMDNMCHQRRYRLRDLHVGENKVNLFI